MFFSAEEQKTLEEMAHQAPGEAPVARSPRPRGRRLWRRNWPPTGMSGCSSSRPREERPGFPGNSSGSEPVWRRVATPNSVPWSSGTTSTTSAAKPLAYGAKKVYVIDAPVFRYYRTESYLQATCYLIDKFKPEVVLMGATGLGRDLAGAVATGWAPASPRTAPASRSTTRAT